MGNFFSKKKISLIKIIYNKEVISLFVKKILSKLFRKNYYKSNKVTKSLIIYIKIYMFISPQNEIFIDLLKNICYIIKK